MNYSFIPAIFLFGIASSVFAEESTASKLNVSGNVSVVSAYVSRGGTNGPENDDTTLQAYLRADYQGWYTAYWVSKLGYSFTETQQQVAIGQDDTLTAAQKEQAVSQLNISSAHFYEHDFFVGYTNTWQDWTYDANVAAYYYAGGEDTTGVEAGIFVQRDLSPTLKNNIRIGVQTYLNDTVYMNQWDSYLSVDYSQPLAQGFDLGLSTGISKYQDKGKFEGGTFLNTQKDWVFRHASVQLSHSLFNEPKATGWLRYIVGGENRAGVSQKNMVVAGMRYSF